MVPIVRARESSCWGSHNRISPISCNVSDRIPLLNAQRRRIPPVPPQKKSAQIGHRITENRKQLGVRAVLL